MQTELTCWKNQNDEDKNTNGCTAIHAKACVDKQKSLKLGEINFISSFSDITGIKIWELWVLHGKRSHRCKAHTWISALEVEENNSTQLRVEEAPPGHSFSLLEFDFVFKPCFEQLFGGKTASSFQLCLELLMFKMFSLAF